VSVSLILRPEAEADAQAARDQLEAARPGLGRTFARRLRETLERIESLPELHGFAWQDVRAVRLRQFRHVVYYVVFADRVEVLAILHGACDSSAWQSRT
jgi:toxin ParE1/3/4